MSEAVLSVVPALITGAVSLIGVLIANKKSTALISYRIGELEKKQDRHNGWIEKLIRLEGRMTEAEHDIRDLKTGKGEGR